MICNKCGAQNLDEGRFCTMCGLPLNGEAVPIKKPQKRAVIITLITVAAAILALLFIVILPSFSVGRRINHVWFHKEDKMELTLDFRENTGTLENLLRFPIEIEWELNGDRLGLTMLYKGQPLDDPEEYIVSFGSGGKVMKLTEVGAPSSVKEFTRMD